MHLLPIGVIIGVYRPGGEKEGEGDGDGGNASGSEGGGKGKGWKGKTKGRSGSFVKAFFDKRKPNWFQQPSHEN